MKIRLILVEDDPLARHYLEHLLSCELDIEVIAVTDNGKSALQLISELQPDIAVMDYYLHNGPGPDGHQLVADAKKRQPSLKVVTLTGVTNPYQLSLVHRYGSNSIALKGTQPNTHYLGDIIRNTMLGETCYPETGNLEHKIYEAEKEQYDFESKLNKTQRSILRLLAEYKNTEEIAKTLHVEPGSVRTALSVARKKLNIADNKTLIERYKKLFPDEL